MPTLIKLMVLKKPATIKLRYKLYGTSLRIINLNTPEGVKIRLYGADFSFGATGIA